jgi:hypothetical protein
MPTTIDLTGLDCDEIDEAFQLVGRGVPEDAVAAHVVRLRRAHLLAEAYRIPAPEGEPRA